MEATTTRYDLRTHNGCITIENPASGQHRTFRVSTLKRGNLKGRRILSLLTGPDNEFSYTGFAFVASDGTISVWRSKQGSNLLWEVFARMIANPAPFEEKGAVYHFEGRCRCCNRTLTTPESIQAGIGPVCAGRQQ
jgi:hypothetical protein